MDLPSETQIRWILQNTARLLSDGAEPVRGLVLPTGEFFPDAFDASPKAVAALASRILKHAGLADVSAEVIVAAPDGTVQKASCSSGACGGGGAFDTKLDRVMKREDGSYAITVGAGEVKHSVALTTALTRAVSLIFLEESGAMETVLPRDAEATVDLTAVLLGFGVLVCNGSHIYQKGCGGVSVHSATKMGVDELALALAIFCELHQVPARLAEKHLETTPREHFDESSVWAASNRKVVKMLRSDPIAIEEERYHLSEARSWLSRALGIGTKKRSTPEEELAQLEKWVATPSAKKEVDPKKAARLAEIRAFMEENAES
ncbi:MAG: hypothetical protein IPK82_22170 [Polyangiaceae bacterium]|nr:hypothetical protein [Polyangiaceae bacterium]